MKRHVLDDMPPLRPKGPGLKEWLKRQQRALYNKELEVLLAVHEFERIHHWHQGCAEFTAGLVITILIASPFAAAFIYYTW